MLKKAVPVSLALQNQSAPHKPPTGPIISSIILFFGLLFVGAACTIFIAPQREVQAAEGLVYSLGNGWFLQNPLPQLNTLYSVSCPATSECYAVGDKGVIINRQEPAASDWKLQASGVTQTLAAVSCTGPGHCLAAGDKGTLLRTSDSGQSWTPLSITTTQALNRLVCLSGSGVCYVSDGNNLFKSTNQGDNWASIYYSTTNNITALSCPQADSCYLLQKYVLSKTTDGGQTWSSQVLSGTYNSYYQETYGALNCPTVNTCYILHPPHGARLGGVPSASYQVLKTSDGGQTWTALFDSPVANLTNITCPAENICYGPTTQSYSGTYHAFYKTTDGGQSWQPQDITLNVLMLSGPQYFYLSGISCPGVTQCYGVGSLGEIYATSDGGQNWQNQLGGVISLFGDLDCYNIATCYVVAGDLISQTNSAITVSNYLVKTDNAGGKWTLQPRLVSNDGFGKISCPARQVCFLTSSGPLYQTNDGGQTWITHSVNISDAKLYQLKCPTVTICYSSDSNKGTIYKTGDGGQSWVSQVVTTSTFNTIECADPNTCYAGGAGLYRTADGGQTWSLIPNLDQAQYNGVSSISCPSLLVCYASRTPASCAVISPAPPNQKPCYLMYKTTDGGVTWQSLGQRGGVISCPSVAICYLNGANYGISYSTDGGVSWTVVTAFGGDYLKCPLSCVSVSVFSPIAGNYNLPDVSDLGLDVPSSPTVSQAVSITLTAQTVSGTVASGYRGTVHFSSSEGSDGPGALPADYTFTAADAGVHTFEVTFNSVGSRTITATDTTYRVLTTQAVENVIPPCTPFVVTSQTDDGGGTACGTLSYALRQAETASVPVTISFASPIITLTQALPVITPTVRVSLDGGCAGSGAVGVPGVKIVAANNSISTAFVLTTNMSLNGVSVSGFGGYGIVLGHDNTLTCSQVGPDPASSQAHNGGGVRLLGANNGLGLAGIAGSGNRIGGNHGAGLLVESGSQGNQAYYTVIGFAPDGLTPQPNEGGGLRVQSGGQLFLGRGNLMRG